MKYLEILSVMSAAMIVASCDNGAQLSAGQDGRGVETVDFFGMENGESETIPFEPGLGFALPDRGTLAVTTAVIGSTTNGSEYRTDCGTGQVLAGIEGFASNNRVSQVGAKCVEVDATGNWVGTPQVQGNPVGITSGNPVSLDCTSGQGVTGVSGFTQNDSIASLQLHCRTLANSKSTVGDETDTERAGDYQWGIANQFCGSGAVATGIHGRANNELQSFGLVCNESPDTAGRWSNPIGWPVQAVHMIMTPQGNVMSYGFKDGSGNVFDYDVWDPSLGTAESSHNTFASDQGVFSFCNASIVMPANGNILLPGGTKLNSDNAGVSDVPVYNTQTGGLSRAPDMANRRWYPTTITLPSGEILVAGGRDVAGVATRTPEIFSPETNEWRSLFGANMLGLEWPYPRLWVANDGRVFGISRNDMFYINPQGSGSIQRAGNFSVDYLTKAESTALMYRPGKILQLGGNVSGGNQALIIDINGAIPEVRLTNSMRLSRSAWINSQVMADGKVMAIGGSRIVQNAATAALNPEIWDPETEQWTVVSGFKWPRLYHSNSILLQDGTVMIAGGGNPGPVTNYNAEIFSPPYLYDENGGLAVRPVINWAPEQGAYGQTIALNTDAAAISKVTFIKTSAVTHSFNVEQRYMELPFTVGTNSVQVQLPANSNDATPGYYLMFVLNDAGTPSEAAIIKLGNDPAEEPPTPEITPEPAETNNILANGGFEQGKTGWQDCSDAALSNVSNNASHGENSLLQQNGACLYQEFVVQPGATYSMNCEAFSQNSVYSSISLNMLNANYETILNDASVVASSTYSSYPSSLQAPADAAYAAVTLYSEGPTHFDSCVVTSGVIAPPAPPPVVTPTLPVANLLVNGDFEQDKASWFDCAGDQLTQIIDDVVTDSKTLQVSNAGCIYQEFAVNPGKQYRVQCRAKSEGSLYSSISFQMADASYNQLESAVSLVGPGQFQTYTTVLTAPAASSTSAVTIYSEDTTQIDVCYAEEV